MNFNVNGKMIRKLELEHFLRSEEIFKTTFKNVFREYLYIMKLKIYHAKNTFLSILEKLLIFFFYSMNFNILNRKTEI